MYLRKDKRGYYQVMDSNEVIEHIGTLKNMVRLVRYGKEMVRKLDKKDKFALNNIVPERPDNGV